MSAPWLRRTLPGIAAALEAQPALLDRDLLWAMLRRVLAAPAPSTGANLPGGVGDVIAALAGELGLGDRLIRQVGSTGNCALWLGVERERPDVVIVSHMDRPTYRVLSPDDATLYPICANRFPAGDYRARAQALRFADGRLTVGARGDLVSCKTPVESRLTFEAHEGRLAWQDSIVLDVEPVCDSRGVVVGTGLDNGLGVITALLVAAVLRPAEDILRAHDRRLLVVFTDQEEGPPDSFFGHGAARLAYAVPQPVLGCVIVDGHNAGMAHGPVLGGGVSAGAVSNAGRGSLVPPNYHALALDLAADLNATRPGTVQINNGYLSRSDDVALARWTRILALAGAPLEGAHTAQETAYLNDVQAAVWWLGHLLPAVLALSPDLNARYALQL